VFFTLTDDLSDLFNEKINTAEIPLSFNKEKDISFAIIKSNFLNEFSLSVENQRNK
jgi:hypothetical protein